MIQICLLPTRLPPRRLLLPLRVLKLFLALQARVTSNPALSHNRQQIFLSNPTLLGLEEMWN